MLSTDRYAKTVWHSGVFDLEAKNISRKVTNIGLTDNVLSTVISAWKTSGLSGEWGGGGSPVTSLMFF